MSFSDFLDQLADTVMNAGSDTVDRVVSGMAAGHRRNQGLPTTAQRAPNSRHVESPGRPSGPRDFHTNPARARSARDYMVLASGMTNPMGHTDRLDSAFGHLGDERGLVPISMGGSPALGYWDGNDMRLVNDRTKLGRGALRNMHDPIELPRWEEKSQLNPAAWLNYLRGRDL